MSSQRHIRNVALIGFMGTGKSTVGRVVAEMLHFEFLDTDEAIESRAGMAIAEIFKQHGEPAFRELEKKLVAELASRSGVVISCGGGMAASQVNLDRLKQHSLVICLWAAPEKILHRVRHQSHRPLLHDPDPLAKIKTLLAERTPFYRQADVMINTEHRAVRTLARQIAHQFHLAPGRQG